MTREQLIIAHLPIVRSVATYMRTRLPHSIELDDLIGIGHLALVRAIDAYDPEHPAKVPLRIWIRYKVRGEMIDAYSGRNFRYELHAPLPPPSSFPTPPAPVADRILSEERHMLLELASRRLRRRERAVLSHALRGEPMARVGRRLGVSERRAGQLRAAAVERVRGTIRTIEGANHHREPGDCTTGLGRAAT